jgi:hypothetical protein
MQPIDTKVNKMCSKILSEPLQVGIAALTQLVSCCTYTLPILRKIKRTGRKNWHPVLLLPKVQKETQVLQPGPT